MNNNYKWPNKPQQQQKHDEDIWNIKGKKGDHISHEAIMFETAISYKEIAEVQDLLMVILIFFYFLFFVCLFVLIFFH